VNGPAHLPRQVILPVAHPPGVRPLQDWRPLEFCRGAEDVQQKTRGAVSLVRVQPLSYGDEADTVVFQDLDVV